MSFGGRSSSAPLHVSDLRRARVSRLSADRSLRLWHVGLLFDGDGAGADGERGFPLPRGETPADRPSPFFPSPQGPGGIRRPLKEGGGAPKGATSHVPPPPPRPALAGPEASAGAPSAEARRLSALHRGDFGPRDRASGTRTADSSPALSRGFRPARPVPSSPCGQPPVVGADGDPTPPGPCLRGTAAGAAVPAPPT